MKPQDLLFFVVVILILIKRSSKLAVWLGLICLFLAIPLFAKWVFFTAERLTWYAAAFFLVAILLRFFQNKK